MTAVTRDQFRLQGNSVVHVPTGAEFTAYPETPEPHMVNWGFAGDVLPNGEDYEREEVLAVAVSILAERKLDQSRI